MERNKREKIASFAFSAPQFALSIIHRDPPTLILFYNSLPVGAPLISRPTDVQIGLISNSELVLEERSLRTSCCRLPDNASAADVKGHFNPEAERSHFCLLALIRIRRPRATSPRRRKAAERERRANGGTIWSDHDQSEWSRKVSLSFDCSCRCCSSRQTKKGRWSAAL